VVTHIAGEQIKRFDWSKHRALTEALKNQYTKPTKKRRGVGVCECLGSTKTERTQTISNQEEEITIIGAQPDRACDMPQKKISEGHGRGAPEGEIHTGLKARISNGGPKNQSTSTIKTGGRGRSLVFFCWRQKSKGAIGQRCNNYTLGEKQRLKSHRA